MDSIAYHGAREQSIGSSDGEKQQPSRPVRLLSRGEITYVHDEKEGKASRSEPLLRESGS